ncbi:MAG TPA: SRPBCC domain-containing protein [Kofleriaceae bacterium]|nr:SRPBCC domain-containing protein [Kofleriaceae bacterium]
MTLAFSLDRTIVIRARRAAVFRFFTDSARFARWWGEGSSIEPRVGGAVRIRYPDGSTASGEVAELAADARIAFTYGYDAPGKPIAPGGSLVTITLHDVPEGTRLELRHDVADRGTRDDHVQGWRYQLAVFARVVAEDVFAPDPIAAWFAAWNDAAPRERLAGAVAPEVTFRDAHGCTRGVDELVQHIAASHRFMPGVRLEQRGAPRHAHATALVEWAAVRDGKTLAAGTDVFRFDADGKIAECVGIAS